MKPILTWSAVIGVIGIVLGLSLNPRAVWCQSPSPTTNLAKSEAPNVPSNPQRAEDDIRRDATVRAVEVVMPSVVNIATEEIRERSEAWEQFFGYRQEPEKNHSLGSGVIIDEEGYLLTNFHVVKNASRILVRLANGEEYEAQAISGGAWSDVALLKIKGKPGQKFKAVKFAPEDDLLLGETVIALGNPFGLGGSVSRGILSSKNRRPPTDNEPLYISDWLQTDAAINPGNSGGPLINLRGELIGLNVAVSAQGQGIGWAIPIRQVSEGLSSYISPEVLGRLLFGARVRFGSLEVTKVEPGTPAAKSGLQVGDVIQKVEGQPSRNLVSLMERLVNAGSKSAVKLGILRKGQPKELSVKLVAEGAVYNEQLIAEKLGISIQELSPQITRAYGLPDKSWLIREVEKGSAADKAGLVAEMLVEGLDGSQLPGIAPAARYLQRKKAGETVVLRLRVPLQSGRYVQLRQYEVKLKVR